MQPRLKPLRDLQKMEAGGADHWQSTGDDPGFTIAFPLIRKRYVLVELASDAEELDPKIYVNYGFGFSENDAVSPHPGKRHVLLIDVGLVGPIRALRLDPATFPVGFSCRVEGYSSRAAADTRVRRLSQDHADVRFQSIDNLGKMLFLGRRLGIPMRSQTVGSHAKRIYALAEKVPEPAKPSGTWLSIVVPVHDTPPRYLDALVASVQRQSVGGAELILSDDASASAETLRWLATHAADPGIAVVRNSRNQGIAGCTNAGLAAARGHWVALLDHDDLIAPHALKMIRRTLDAHPRAQFVYTDELVVDDRLKAIGYMLKPAFDPVLLSGVNYINHLSLYRRDRLTAIGSMRLGLDGSQDYDLLLRYLDGLEDDEVVHLPYPAYWWRRTGKTFSRRHMEQATANARTALLDSYSVDGEPIVVEPALTPTLHRVSFDRDGAPLPKISIVIPNKNAPKLIGRVLDDLYRRTDYPDFEVIVVDNGTSHPDVLALYERMASAHPGFRVDTVVEAFNFSRSVNRGLAAATGEHVLLLNNDVEVIDPLWLREMVSCLSYKGAGIVGAKLLFPDGRIQHAGVVAGFGGLAGHWYLNKPGTFGGPMNRLHVRSSMTCVTGAVMLISGACRRAVGQFDEEHFAVAYNDVDYCLRAYDKGFRTVWTPFAALYHHESASRGSEETLENRARFEIEKANLRRLHGTMDFVDPATSPMHGRASSTPTLQRAEALPAARTWFGNRRDA